MGGRAVTLGAGGDALVGLVYLGAGGLVMRLWMYLEMGNWVVGAKMWFVESKVESKVVSMWHFRCRFRGSR